jgi:hypothetical protein
VAQFDEARLNVDTPCLLCGAPSVVEVVWVDEWSPLFELGNLKGSRRRSWEAPRHSKVAALELPVAVPTGSRGEDPTRGVCVCMDQLKASRLESVEMNATATGRGFRTINQQEQESIKATGKSTDYSPLSLRNN